MCFDRFTFTMSIINGSNIIILVSILAFSIITTARIIILIIIVVIYSYLAEIDHIVAERKILAQNTHPFLVSLKYSFQTADKIYFVLDYVSGGELYIHLQVR
jgi:serine/threonine protein kinase